MTLLKKHGDFSLFFHIITNFHKLYPIPSASVCAIHPMRPSPISVSVISGMFIEILGGVTSSENHPYVDSQFRQQLISSLVSQTPTLRLVAMRLLMPMTFSGYGHNKYKYTICLAN